MPKQTHIEGGKVKHSQLWADANLDLTREPWLLQDGDASVLIGVDVTRPGVFRPDRGRFPVGTSIPAADRPLTGAFPCRVRASAPMTYRDVYRIVGVTTSKAFNAAYDPTARTVTLTGEFSGYTVQPGDLCAIARRDVASELIPLGRTLVISKTSNDEIVVADRFGDASVNVKCWIERAGQLDLGRGYQETQQVIDYLVKSKNEYDQSGPWSADMEGGVVFVNEDSRKETQSVTTVTGVTTWFFPNDTLTLGTSLLGGTDARKFHILYEAKFETDGIWLTNGRRFWLATGSDVVEWLDLGDDGHLGRVWRMATIRDGVFLFTSEGTYPRIIHMGYGPKPADATRSIAGCLPLHWNPNVNNETVSGNDVRPITMQLLANLGTDITISKKYRIKLRPINLEEHLQGAMYDVPSDADVNVFTLTPANATDGFLLKSYDHHLRTTTKCAPLRHGRWSHIEVWRTIGDGANYFRESLINVEALRNELQTASPELWKLISGSTTLYIATDNLSDVLLQGFPMLSIDDVQFGLPPPICKEAVNVSGITYCAGAGVKASRTVQIPLAICTVQSGTTAINDPATGQTRFTPNATNKEFDDYAWKEGDVLVVFDGGWDSTNGQSLPVGRYHIVAKTADTTDSVYVDDAPITVGAVTGVRAYIETLVEYEWPVVASDEEVWHSRLSDYAPESFSRIAVVQLSRKGDIFRRLVAVSNYACVVMDGGVHLLQPGSGPDGSLTILKDTVAHEGAGTPWPNSVLVVGNRVFWANRQGVMTMRVSSSANDEGNFGTLMPFDDERVRRWFAEAADNNWDVDAGLDPYNGCLRFRRKQDANTYQVIQFGFRTARFTLLDDDPGIAYMAITTFAGSAINSPRLYSMGIEGAAFEVNRESKLDPYEGKTVQAVLDSGWTVSDISLQKVGAFSSLMLGESMRFRSDNSAVNGRVRTIRTATSDKITFDALPGLTAGDEFLIGAVRFRSRFSPFQGSYNPNIKTIEALQVIAHPGEMHDAGNGWEDDTPGKLTVRAYRNFSKLPADENLNDVPIFSEEADTGNTEDRYSDVQCDGRAIEIEIENLETRTDFRIEAVCARILEEGDMLEDIATAPYGAGG